MTKQTLDPAVPPGEVVLVEPRLPWLVGAIFIFIGLILALSVLSVFLHHGTRTHSDKAAIGAVGAGMSCVFLGALCLLWRNGVLVNYGTRTYSAVRGFLPFVKTLSGPFTDFDRIRLAREERSNGEGNSVFLCVCLLWKENRRSPDDLLVTLDAARAAAEACRMAATLDLPLDDRSAEEAQDTHRRCKRPRQSRR